VTLGDRFHSHIQKKRRNGYFYVKDFRCVGQKLLLRETEDRSSSLSRPSFSQNRVVSGSFLFISFHRRFQLYSLERARRLSTKKTTSLRSACAFAHVRRYFVSLPRHRRDTAVPPRSFFALDSRDQSPRKSFSADHLLSRQRAIVR